MDALTENGGEARFANGQGPRELRVSLDAAGLDPDFDPDEPRAGLPDRLEALSTNSGDHTRLIS